MQDDSAAAHWWPCIATCILGHPLSMPWSNGRNRRELRLLEGKAIVQVGELGYHSPIKPEQGDAIIIGASGIETPLKPETVKGG